MLRIVCRLRFRRDIGASGLGPEPVAYGFYRKLWIIRVMLNVLSGNIGDVF